MTFRRTTMQQKENWIPSNSNSSHLPLKPVVVSKSNNPYGFINSSNISDNSNSNAREEQMRSQINRLLRQVEDLSNQLTASEERYASAETRCVEALEKYSRVSDQCLELQRQLLLSRQETTAAKSQITHLERMLESEVDQHGKQIGEFQRKTQKLASSNKRKAERLKKATAAASSIIHDNVVSSYQHHSDGGGQDDSLSMSLLISEAEACLRAGAKTANPMLVIGASSVSTNNSKGYQPVNSVTNGPEPRPNCIVVAANAVTVPRVRRAVRWCTISKVREFFADEEELSQEGRCLPSRKRSPEEYADDEKEEEITDPAEKWKLWLQNDRTRDWSVLCKEEQAIFLGQGFVEVFTKTGDGPSRIEELTELIIRRYVAISSPPSQEIFTFNHVLDIMQCEDMNDIIMLQSRFSKLVRTVQFRGVVSILPSTIVLNRAMMPHLTRIQYCISEAILFAQTDGIMNDMVMEESNGNQQETAVVQVEVAIEVIQEEDEDDDSNRELIEEETTIVTIPFEEEAIISSICSQEITTTTTTTSTSTTTTETSPRHFSCHPPRSVSVMDAGVVVVEMFSPSPPSINPYNANAFLKEEDVPSEEQQQLDNHSPVAACTHLSSGTIGGNVKWAHV